MKFTENDEDVYGDIKDADANSPLSKPLLTSSLM